MTERENYQLRHIAAASDSALYQIRKRKVYADSETARVLEQIRKDSLLRLIREEGYKEAGGSAHLTIGRYDYSLPMDVVRREAPGAVRRDDMRPLDLYDGCPEDINADFSRMQHIFYETKRTDGLMRFLKDRLYNESEERDVLASTAVQEFAAADDENDTDENGVVFADPDGTDAETSDEPEEEPAEGPVSVAIDHEDRAEEEEPESIPKQDTGEDSDGPLFADPDGEADEGGPVSKEEYNPSDGYEEDDDDDIPVVSGPEDLETVTADKETDTEAENETEKEAEDIEDTPSDFDSYRQIQNALVSLEKAKDAQMKFITRSRSALREQQEENKKIKEEKEKEAHRQAEKDLAAAIDREKEKDRQIEEQKAALSEKEEEIRELKGNLMKAEEELKEARRINEKEKEAEEERKKPVFGAFPESRNIPSISRTDVTMDYFRIRVLSRDDVPADDLEIIVAPLTMKTAHPPVAVWAGRNLISYTFVTGQDMKIGNFEYEITGTMNGLEFSADIRLKTEGYHLDILLKKSFGDRGHILLNDGDIYVHIIPVTFSNDENGSANYMYVTMNKDKCYVGDNHTGKEVHVGTPDDKVIRCSWTDNRLNAALSYVDK